MKQIEFNKNLAEWNGKYKELFGVIPCIWEYSCGREEYMCALQKAVRERKPLGEFLNER